MEEGEIEVESVLPIRLDDVTPELARESGFKSVVDLLKIAKHGRGEQVYLVRFHYVPPRPSRQAPRIGRSIRARAALRDREQGRVGGATTTRKTSVKSARSTGKTVRRTAASKPVLLSGGNPQIAKADGDRPVQAYLAAIPGWKREVGRRLDALIVQSAPGVRKAVRWNSPFYGIEGQGWFVSFHVFARYVKVTFFRGTSLQPVPPGGRSKEARWIDVHEDDLDEAQMAAWIRQAAALPGWGKA
jgi:hypothetical protein